MKQMAHLEPKPFKTFRDKYLAVVMMVAALFTTSLLSAQSDSTKYSQINGYGFRYKRMAFDSVLIVPRSTSPHVPWRAGAIRYNAPDSTLQLWTGNQWNSILTGIGNGIDTAYMINDTVLAIETPNEDFLIVITGKNISNSSLIANGNHTQNWNHFQLYVDSLSGLRYKASEPDIVYPNNRMSWLFQNENSFVGTPFQNKWALRNVLNNSDSVGSSYISDQYGLLLNHYGYTGSIASLNIAGNTPFPAAVLQSYNGGSKTSYLTVGNSIVISAADSVQMKLIPAASADSVIGIRNLGFGLNTLVKVPLSSSSTTTLTNVGTGFRSVTTPNGSIKSAIYGYGVNGDSTSTANTIMVQIDTTESNHVVTTSQLKDTSSAIRNELTAKNLYGLIYAKGSWANVATDFDNNGADTSISAGKILLQPGGSAGTFTQSIGLKNATCLEYWRMLVRYTLKSTPTSTTYGLGVGIRSTNTHVTSSVLTYTDLTTDGTNGGKVFHAVDYPTPAVLETSTGSLSKALNDQFETIIERVGDKITISNRNLTGSSATQATEHTYSTSTAPATELLPNTGKFSLFAIGGLIQIDSISVFSKEMKGADVAALVDSKGKYYASADSSWIAQIRPSFNGVVALSGGGDRPQDIFDRINEVIALQPKQVILECGTNESDTSVVKTYIQKINDTLVAHGIRVIHTAFYQTSPSTLWRHNYISRTFPIVIDNYNPLNQPNTVNIDGLHPAQYGHNIVASNSLSSGKILYGKYYTASTSTSGVSGNFIANGTIPQTADFNMTGGGTASSWTTTGSAPITLTNQFGSSNDGVAFFRTTGTNKTTNIYMSPNGTGSGGNRTSFAMFNTDVTTSPSDFGFASFQMKPSEFYMYTSNVGSGTLPSLKIGTGGSTFQLTLNTNGTTTVNGNANFLNQIAVGPSFTPFSKSLLHASRSVNDAVYNMVSNSNTGNGASVGFKANLDPAREDTNYISIMAVGVNYSQPSRPSLTGGSTLLETTAPGDMFISSHNDTGDVVVTTDTSMIPRLRIAHAGAITFGTGSNSYTFPTSRASAGQVLTDVAGNGSLSWGTPSGGSSYTFSNGITESGGAVKWGGTLTQNTKVSGGVSAYSMQLDSMSSISLFSGLEFISSGIGSSIQMSDSVMNIGSSSATDFTSMTFSPTRIKFIAADGAGNVGDVWTNTGSGYGHWASGPKTYTALLTQSGTGNPTATILGINGIGSIVWTRNSAGSYTGTLTGAFTANKTWLICQKGDGSGSFVNGLLSSTSANTVGLTVTDNAGTSIDNFTNMSIEIRVYP